MTLVPIPVLVTRYRCPLCPRSLSSKTRMVEHIGKCWRNPDVRGCKTCKHFDSSDRGGGPHDPGYLEGCIVGVDLTIRPCPACLGGAGWLDVCDHCSGTGTDSNTDSKPIVGCTLWEATP